MIDFVGSSSSSSSSSSSMTRSDFQEQVMDFLRRNPEGASNDMLKDYFGTLYGTNLTSILNSLLDSKRVVLFLSGDEAGSLVYQIVPEETAVKFDGLGPEQMLVYQICEKAGNKGIWIRDIKTLTNIPQHTLNKTLKILEQRSLIKNVRSVLSKSKKYYMLFNAVPAKEITGGPWYTDQEFDHAFVEDLCKMVLGIVKQQVTADSRTILERLTNTGVIEANCLTQSDLDTVMQVLVYDGRLEEVVGKSSGSLAAAAAIMSGGSTSKPPVRYKVAKDFSSANFLTETPCGVCPVISQCCEGGTISPTSCPYLTEWVSEW